MTLLKAGPFSVRVRHRSLLVSVVLLALLAAALLATLAAGVNAFPIPRVIAAVLGDGTPAENLIIGELRLPRAVVAALVGIAFGVSGGIFQSITRNPLGSPDVVGFSVGASTGALVVLLVLKGSLAATSLGAVAGGTVTAALVFALSSRGGVAPLRLVLVGIGLGAALNALNSLLIVRAQVYDAQSASAWLVGNLVGRDWDEARLVGGVLIAGFVLSLVLHRPLSLSEFSDERSASFGLSTDRTRLLAVGTGVLLASGAVAVAGPIQFIALTAPQVARRLTGAPGPNLVASGLTGALLLVLADLAAREAFQPRQLPVGVLTGLVGGLYLAWLLSREWRKGRA
ncbi:FecCD family ABC transporter permease [Actinoplanes derwentensis]|uniref:Iron complex transport system permease protein n=1 Tax=Actinoplanes derwentensis TaxID=113562 RepID=A0A1H1YD89_9ACTN|nr:iron chelate uptake ABC transporter family permease subunit [Actinoplanes derwentensis]GID81096.1 ABC transporter permease [Actinoplanes derwentensis]SDT19335.1 iron complex transport system permease protein [Actinoplanes derwentensis]